MVSKMISFIIIKKIKVFHVIVAQPLLLILIANVSYSHANYTVRAAVPLKKSDTKSRTCRNKRVLISLVNEKLPFRAINVRVSWILPSHICSFPRTSGTRTFSLLESMYYRDY